MLCISHFVVKLDEVNQEIDFRWNSVYRTKILKSVILLFFLEFTALNNIGNYIFFVKDKEYRKTQVLLNALFCCQKKMNSNSLSIS